MALYDEHIGGVLNFDDQGRRVLAAARRGGVIGLWTLQQVARTAWTIMRQPLVTAFNVIAALFILFEEWGWRPLAAVLARLGRYPLWAAIEARIAGLPPYGALAVFAAPTVLLFPLKLAAVWLLAQGHVFSAAALLGGAKIASTAFLARVFLLTRPALMRIGWFASAYNRFMPWKEAMFARIRSSRPWRYGRIVAQRTRASAVSIVRRYGPPVRRALTEAGQRVTLWWRS